MVEGQRRVTGGTSNVALSTVLGTGTAYDYSTFDVTAPTRAETYWDCSTAYAAASDQGQALAQMIHRLYTHLFKSM